MGPGMFDDFEKLFIWAAIAIFGFGICVGCWVIPTLRDIFVAHWV